MKAENVIIPVLTAAVGCGIGVLTTEIKHLKNTPEDTIRRLNSAKEQSKSAAAEARTAKAENLSAYRNLVNKKEEYKNEVRNEIESQVRKELGDYILNADATYEKAKKENELAQLKLELAKSRSGATFEFTTK